MKICRFTLAILILIMNLFWVGSARGENIVVDGLAIKEPFLLMDRGSILIDLRSISRALGAEQVWNPELQNIKIEKGEMEIYLYIGVGTGFVNRVLTPVNYPPQFVDQQPLVPLRFVSETLGNRVSWDEATRTVFIAKSQRNQ